MFWRKKKITDDLKAAAEVAGEQIAPGAGTLFVVLGAAAAIGVTAYMVRRRRKNKKAAQRAALPKPEKPG
jgi:LPXTG-motif cell wall-anchored protein